MGFGRGQSWGVIPAPLYLLNDLEPIISLSEPQHSSFWNTDLFRIWNRSANGYGDHGPEMTQEVGCPPSSRLLSGGSGGPGPSQVAALVFSVWGDALA